MTTEDKIKYWSRIDQDIKKLQELQKEVMNGMMPYAIDSVILCKGKYHTNKPGRVIKYYINRFEFTWKVKIVVQAIGDAGNELGPTDWDEKKDFRLQDIADLLNKILPVRDAKDTSMIFN